MTCRHCGTIEAAMPASRLPLLLPALACWLLLDRGGDAAAAAPRGLPLYRPPLYSQEDVGQWIDTQPVADPDQPLSQLDPVFNDYGSERDGMDSPTGKLASAPDDVLDDGSRYAPAWLRDILGSHHMDNWSTRDSADSPKDTGDAADKTAASATNRHGSPRASLSDTNDSFAADAETSHNIDPSNPNSAKDSQSLDSSNPDSSKHSSSLDSSKDSPDSPVLASSSSPSPAARFIYFPSCQYSGRAVAPGTFWPEPCVACRCDATTGRVTCRYHSPVVCPKLPGNCVRWSPPVAGSCCPVCAAVGCRLDGATYASGSRIPTGPCRTCYCPWEGGDPTADAAPVCMDLTCPPPPCVDAEVRDGQCCPVCPNGPNCLLDGQIIPAGEHIYADSCRICQCPAAAEGREATCVRSFFCL